MNRMFLSALSLVAVAGVVAVVVVLTRVIGDSAEASTPVTFGIEPSSDYQKAAAADGFVSDEEMQAAVVATVGCLRAKGLDAQLPPGDPRDRVAQTILVTSATEGGPTAAVAECKAEFMTDLSRIFARQEDARSPITSNEALRLFDECLTSKGYAPAAGDPIDPYSSERLGSFQDTPEGGRAIIECNTVVKDARRAPPP